MPSNWTDSRAALNLTRELDFFRSTSFGNADGVVFPNGREFTYEFLTEYDPLFNAFGGLTSILDHPDDFNPANEFDQVAFRTAFDLWSDLANVTFREGGGDIEIGYGYSRRAAESDPGFGFDNGIWINDNGHLSDSNFFSSAQEPWFTTFLHEIGHAIGLAHPGDYNGRATFSRDAQYYQDTDQYTLMSYFQEWENGSGVNYSSSEPNTPMLHDVLAIQALYGPNLSTRTGDNVYGFAASGDGMRDAFDFTKNTTPVVTIWDAAGEDTLNLSGSTASQRIDLSPGSYSDAMGMEKNLAIAFGTDIENAIGGVGDDVLIGSDIDNMLDGSDGNDELWGRLGNDDLFGNTGADLVVGGLGRDKICGGEGDDVLFGGDQLQPGSKAPVTDAAFDPVGYISNAFSTSGWYSFNVRQMYFGNFEGDAKAEFVGLKRGNDAKTVETHIRDEDGSFVALEPDRFVDWRIQNHNPREVGDVNGDGFDDLVGFSDKHVYVGVSNGDGTFQDPIRAMSDTFGRDQGWTTQSRFPRKIADVDGDGNADLVGFGRSAVYVARGQDDGTFADHMVAHTDFRDGYGGWRDQFDTPRTIGDVNGDGRADIVGFKGTEVHVALGQADGTFGETIATGDFGKEDALGRTTYFGNSDHFPRHLGDINGDGFDDIVVFTHERDSEPPLNRVAKTILPDDTQAEQVLVAFGIGDGTFHSLTSIDVPGLPENGRSDDFDWLRFDVVDINGDGRDDIAGFSYNKGVWVAYSQGDDADQISGGAGNDTLYGDMGNDMLRGGIGSDVIDGGDGNDSVYGEAGYDHLYGGNGVDRMYGGTNNDRLYGGSGNDLLWGGQGADLVRGDTGDDRLYGGGGNDRLSGLSGNDLAYGQSGNDRLSGHSGNDRLFGGAGLDIINGGGGSDVLDGGTGSDTLYGGTQADTFVFKIGTGSDLIMDFEDGLDKILIGEFGLTFDSLEISEMEDGAEVSIGLDALLLESIDVSQLGQDDFVFIV